MPISKKRIFMLVAIGVAVIVATGRTLFSPQGIDPIPEAQIELTKVIDGMTFKLTDQGELYRVDDRTGKWHYHDTVFDLKGMMASYRVEGDATYRINPETNESIPTRRRFREGFEALPTGVEGTRRMIGIERGWGALTLQSPSAPQVKDYVRLRSQILTGGGDFRDASVAPDDSKFRSGSLSLKCVAPPRTSDMICCKSSISSPLIYFRQGDDFWFRGYFFAGSSRPHTIMDLECEWLKQHSGIRVMIDEMGRLGVELKALDKPKYRQTMNDPILFPLGQWVEVKVHFVLSHTEDGVIQLWQDGQLVVDTHGVTLPLKRAIYNSLEIGISAHSYGDLPCELWVDDLEVSDQPFAN
ncbi:MAG: hypothetical protein H7A55_02720 [Verrucomicrobiaceae bacterium]|nr:hypothetical protein [Verrucomicrobiaceae bacterium]